MKSFQDAECPKCLSLKNEVYYCSGKETESGCFEGPDKEHLHCTCLRCGYDWLEKCAG